MVTVKEDIATLFFSRLKNKFVRVVGGIPIVTSFSISGRVEESIPSTFKVVNGQCLMVFDLSKASFEQGRLGIWEIQLPDVAGGLSVEELAG